MLSKEELEALLEEEDVNDRLIVSPILSTNQVGAASIDLRLGYHFLLPRRSNVGYVDPMEPPSKGYHPRNREALTLSRNRTLYLHPTEFVLGATLEYMRLPLSVGGYVTSRSSWGRTGLVIATATSVAPGFCGSITLELANVGSAPLALRPGVRIAQIILHRVKPTAEYVGRYPCPTGPEQGKIHLDDELPFWTPRNEGASGDADRADG